MCKTSIFKMIFPCLYNFTLPKYRWDPDPVKNFRILPKRFGSGSATLDPDHLNTRNADPPEYLRNIGTDNNHADIMVRQCGQCGGESGAR